MRSPFSLWQFLLQAFGRGKKQRTPFASEKEAYDFCQRVYQETGGVTPELRRAFEFYLKNYNDECPPGFGPSPR